jgi:hypothetical protein
MDINTGNVQNKIIAHEINTLHDLIESLCNSFSLVYDKKTYSIGTKNKMEVLNTKSLFHIDEPDEIKLLYLKGINKYLHDVIPGTKLTDKLIKIDEEIVKNLQELLDSAQLNQKDLNVMKDGKNVNIKDEFLKNIYRLQLKILFISLSDLKEPFNEILVRLGKGQFISKEVIKEVSNPEVIKKIQEKIKNFLSTLNDKTETLSKLIDSKTLSMENDLDIYNKKIISFGEKMETERKKVDEENKKISEENKKLQLGGHINYKHKYLKYKTKYINLKNY